MEQENQENPKSFEEGQNQETITESHQNEIDTKNVDANEIEKEDDEEDEFGDFEESNVDNNANSNKFETEQTQTNEFSKEENKVDTNDKKEAFGLMHKTSNDLMNLFISCQEALVNKKDKGNFEILLNASQKNFTEIAKIQTIYEKIPIRISGKFKELLSTCLKKKISKEKINNINKIPLDNDDKQFSLKLIEDLNKVWEGLSTKKNVKDFTKIKSPEYDFFLEELSKGDFTKKKQKSSEKLKTEKMPIVLNTIINERTALYNMNQNLMDEIIPSDLFNHLNKPFINYHYSTILNQNFTESFKLKQTVERKTPLKKAFSSVLKENDMVSPEKPKLFENLLSAALKKNSFDTPKLEKKNSEPNNNIVPKKVSIDEMNVFGFDIDLDNNNNTNYIVDKRINEENSGREGKDNPDVSKSEDNTQEIKKMLPNYEDIFN